MSSSNINIFSDPQSLAEAACENFLDRAEIAVKQRGVFTVALSGGSTPSIMYKILVKKIQASSGYQELLQKIHFFWGDERHVSPKSPQSNFGNAYNDFFSKITISQDSIHRIKSEIKDASEAADDYEKVLRHFFQLKEGEFPIFDLIFLGMGLDGHTASLFPGNDVIQDAKGLAGLPFFVVLVIATFLLGLLALSAQLLVALILATGLTILIRTFYFERRPDRQSYKNFFEKIDASSFPSLHAMRAAVLATLLAAYFANLWLTILFWACAIVVALARVLLKRHFVKDVIVGLIAGVLIAYFSVYLVNLFL